MLLICISNLGTPHVFINTLTYYDVRSTKKFKKDGMKTKKDNLHSIIIKHQIAKLRQHQSIKSPYSTKPLVNLQTGPSKTHLKTLMAHNYLRYLQTYSSGSLVNFIFAPSTYPIKVIE